MEHFSYGLLTPALAYVLSTCGCWLGLVCVTRARMTERRTRQHWLTLAAVSLGGTGVWGMHFTTMVGFSVPGAGFDYDVPVTLTGMALSVALVGAGLTVAVRRLAGVWSMGAAALICGAGAAVMFYLSVGAVRSPQHLGYDHRAPALAAAVSVLASVAVLWCGRRVRPGWLVAGVAMVVGAALTGTHYLGVASLDAVPRIGRSGVPVASATSDRFLAPMAMTCSVTTLVVLFVVALWPGVEQMRADADMDARLAALAARTPLR